MGLSVVSAAQVAEAQVSWHGNEQCAPVNEPVAVGSEPHAEPGLHPVNSRVDIQVERVGSRWVATLSALHDNGVTGTRTITAQSCAELQRAVVMALSLLAAAEPAMNDAPPSRVTPVQPVDASKVEPVIGQLEGPLPPAGSRESAPVPVRRVAPEIRDRGGPAPSGPLGRELGWFGGVHSRFAMAGTDFAEVGAALSTGAWLGDWGARVQLGARQPLAEVEAQHALALELRRYDLAMDLCARTGRGLEWALCGGPRLELLHAVVPRLSQPVSDTVWLPGLGASGRLRLPLAGGWAISAELQGTWSLLRARARVAPWGTVYELPAVGSSVLLGAEWVL